MTTNQMALVSTNPSMVSNRFLLMNGQLGKRRERCGEVNSTLQVIVYIIFWFAWCACFFFFLACMYVFLPVPAV